MADQIRLSRQDVDFIRLFFPGSVEEEIAARWASRLALLIGPRIVELRPETTLQRCWIGPSQKMWTQVDFVVVFEPELRMQLAFFLEDPDRATFREMVRYVGEQYGSVALGRDSILGGNLLQPLCRVGLHVELRHPG